MAAPGPRKGPGHGAGRRAAYQLPLLGGQGGGRRQLVRGLGAERVVEAVHLHEELVLLLVDVLVLRRLVEHGRLRLRVVLEQLHVGQHCGTDGAGVTPALLGGDCGAHGCPHPQRAPLRSPGPARPTEAPPADATRPDTTPLPTDQNLWTHGKGEPYVGCGSGQQGHARTGWMTDAQHSGGEVTVGEAGTCGNSLYFPLNVAVSLKPL